MKNILAIDDEISIRESYRMILGGDYHLLLAENGHNGLDALAANRVDLVLLDLSMPGMNGMEFLEAMSGQGLSVPVIVITGSNTVDVAVQAMKQGANEFVMKPFDVNELVRKIEGVLAEDAKRRSLCSIQDIHPGEFEGLIGDAPLFREALNKARMAMQVDSTVLITGETGTGKDVLARAIHQGSQRKDKQFVPLCCGAIPANLVESELFGTIKGAFTGATDSRQGKMELAHRGTLFLDEIGEMPTDAQVKLLRVLQDGSFYAVGGNVLKEVDVRFICATNRPFDEAIAEGLFREDLYYRINVLPIEMPALRNRRQDIPKLVSHFVRIQGAKLRSQVEEFAPRAMARLTAAPWPGNVRQLQNTVERLLVCYGNERVIKPEHLDEVLPKSFADPKDVSLENFDGLSLQQATQRVERFVIRQALERNSFIQSKAADALGTTRRILKYKMDQLGIESPVENQPDSLAG
ncbi:MAG: sigma-54-dependent Fis family transcriptional regulator [Candidatus Hydrogenedentes bacterium]|nr:sigma-54-dependent Fis family transcriptional regulator [Candidatus Hydrogenedentota bacterium]